MKIMKEIVTELLEKKKNESFENIWEHVKKNSMKEWLSAYADTKESELERNKIGELYTMLTTQGDFVKDNTEKWSLSKNFSYEEVKKMKINIVELEDE